MGQGAGARSRPDQYQNNDGGMHSRSKGKTGLPPLYSNHLGNRGGSNSFLAGTIPEQSGERTQHLVAPAIPAKSTITLSTSHGGRLPRSKSSG